MNSSIVLRNKKKEVLFIKCKILTFSIALLVGMTLILGNVFSLNEVIAQSTNTDNKNNKPLKNFEKEVPSLKVSFEETDLDLDPFIHKENGIITQIGIPQFFETQTNDKPEFTVKQGDKLTLEYGKQPLEMKAYIIDYDSDVNEIYPVKQLDYSTIMIPEDAPQGLKNLEIRCTYDNNEQVSYTTSMFIRTTEDNDDEGKK
ncbi:MAG TPA: hypothetical protein VLA74_12450 [Nitrososphaeraceae archaeon]|nr:hypothetical protein [Nitrososphaeraceae archaeon]